MRSRTSRGVSKCSRGKDSYIGRLYSDIGKVPSDSGIFRSTGELREFSGGSNEPYWAIRECRRQAKGEVAPPHPWVLIGLGEGGGAPLALSYSLSLALFPSPLLLKGKGS